MKVWILDYKTTAVLAIWNEVKHAIRTNEHVKFDDRLYVVKEVSWEGQNEETIFVEEVKTCSCFC